MGTQGYVPIFPPSRNSKIIIHWESDGSCVNPFSAAAFNSIRIHN